MKKIAIILLSFFLSGCSYFLKGQLEISVTANDSPLSEAQLVLYGKKNKKEIFIQKLSPNGEGKIVLPVDFYEYEMFKIVATSSNLDKLLLPSISYVSSPHWWQDQSVQLKINLISPVSPFTANTTTPKKEVVSQEIKNDLSQLPPPEIVSVSQIEKNLQEEPIKKKSNKPPLVLAQEEKELELKHEKVELKPLKKTITDKKKDFIVSVSYKVLFESKPVNEVQVYTAYHNSQTIRKEGESNSLGEIKFNVNKVSAPDVIILIKNGFVTLVSPFIESSSQGPFIFDLKLGKSVNLLVQNYAYNLPRGIEKSELFFNKVKQNSSTSIGLLTYDKEIKVEDALSLEIKNSQINSISWDDIQKKLFNKLNLNSFFLPTLMPFKPTIGLLEPVMNEERETNTIWRRARREFFSRFINDSSFKTKIQDDLFNLSNAKSSDDLIVFKKGWENTLFAKDVDIILQIDLKTKENDAYMVGRIYGKNGEILFEQNKLIAEGSAEKVASQLYLSLLNHLPLEGSVVGQDKGVYILNLGAKNHIQKGDVFSAFVSKENYSLPTVYAGKLKVFEVEQGQVKAQIMKDKKDLSSKKDNEFLKNNSLIRVVRLSRVDVL